MTNWELLELFGDADTGYVRKAQALRSGASPAKGRSVRRVWILAAAVITLAALSISAYAAIQARMRMELTQSGEQTIRRETREFFQTYYPQQLPEGYAMTSWGLYGDVWNICYENDAGQRISFSLSAAQDFRDMPLQAPVEEQTLTVGDGTATLMTSQAGGRLLLWKVPEGDCSAAIFTEDAQADILAMAESAAVGEPLEAAANQWNGPDYNISLEQNQDSYVEYEPWYPLSLPDGYTLDFVSDEAYGVQYYRYTHPDGGSMQYAMYFRLGQWGLEFSGDGDVRTVEIGENTGYYAAGENKVYWTDLEHGFGFVLSATEDVDVLEAARSVGLGEAQTVPLDEETRQALEQLGDYRITQLPQGMTQVDLAGLPLEQEESWYSYVRRWYADKRNNHQVYMEYSTYVTDPEYTVSLQDLANQLTGGGNPQPVTVGDCIGALAETESGATLAWVQGELAGGLGFTLYSDDLSGEELLTLAQSVKGF